MTDPSHAGGTLLQSFNALEGGNPVPVSTSPFPTVPGGKGIVDSECRSWGLSPIRVSHGRSRDRSFGCAGFLLCFSNCDARFRHD